ncbi:MAG: hypothetical protein KJO29_09835, partial [Bacteroidia bacterium]|nr:hypothetical protein [Bacteroidia bacterium]
MKKVSERLAYKITEGYQAPSLSDVQEETNIFYRKVKVMETGNLSFILGMSSSGLRTTAYLDRHMLLNNINSITMASRWHLPVIINTSVHSSSCKDSNSHNFYNAIKTLQSAGCFQFVAFSAQEEIYLTLIACRVSELSLIPGIVIADYTSKNGEIPEFPSDKKIRTYLGNPDDQIECPTPAQQIIFGTHRRRVPSWYNYDTPVQLGSLKNSKDLAYENAARKKFFQEHLDDTISQAFSEFNDIFDIDIEPVSGGLKNPAAIISYSGRINEMIHEKGSDLDKTDFIKVRQIHPLPKKSIKKYIERRKSVTVLEDSGFIASGHSLISREIADITKESSLKFYSAGFSPDLTHSSLVDAA